jgi:hypothetical protein
MLAAQTKFQRTFAANWRAVFIGAAITLLAIYGASCSWHWRAHGREVSASEFFDLATKNRVPRSEQVVSTFRGKFVTFVYTLDLKFLHAASVRCDENGRMLAGEQAERLAAYDDGFAKGWTAQVPRAVNREIEATGQLRPDTIPPMPVQFQPFSEIWNLGFRNACSGCYRWNGKTPSRASAVWW